MSKIGTCQLRVARPTNDIGSLRNFYCKGLGFEVLFEFGDHDGFDGLIIGHPGGSYHLEFTTKRGHDAGRAPSEDNLLVFYIPERQSWESAVTRMHNAGVKAVPAFNSYWDRVGKTFEDPDGYRVVIQNASWTNETGQRLTSS